MNQQENDISLQCVACNKFNTCKEDKTQIINESECHDFDCKINYCEECFEPLKRNGFTIYCENGCTEEDIRNNYSEDQLEELGIDYSQYPNDENEDCNCKCNGCSNVYCGMKLKAIERSEENEL